MPFPPGCAMPTTRKSSKSRAPRSVSIRADADAATGAAEPKEADGQKRPTQVNTTAVTYKTRAGYNYSTLEELKAFLSSQVSHAARYVACVSRPSTR